MQYAEPLNKFRLVVCGVKRRKRRNRKTPLYVLVKKNNAHTQNVRSKLTWDYIVIVQNWLATRVKSDGYGFSPDPLISLPLSYRLRNNLCPPRDVTVVTYRPCIMPELHRICDRPRPFWLHYQGHSELVKAVSNDRSLAVTYKDFSALFPRPIGNLWHDQ